MLAIARYVFLTCMRARLLGGVVITMIAVAALSWFMGGTALIEEKETARALAAGSLRLAMVSGIALLICFHIQHMVHSRELAVIAARPIPRWQLVLGCFGSYAAIAFGLAMLAGLAEAFMGFRFVGSYLSWVFGMGLEAVIVAAAAVMFGLIISNAVSACLCTLGFYLLSRLAILFLTTAESPMSKSGSNMLDAAIYYSIKIISTVLPRLDLFADSALLVYGKAAAPLGVIGAQTVIYVPLLLTLAVLDFSRKEL